MEDHTARLAQAAHFLHRHFLWLLFGVYALATVWPAPGLWLREIRFSAGGTLRGPLALSLPALLLAGLLFNAGLGVQVGRLRSLVRNPLVLLLGLAANLAVPLLFLLGIAQALRFWHNPDEVQHILVGLALVASMPVAGSSAAWSQNARGDLALSLGLVVLSTCLSPLTTPAALHAAGWVARGLYADSLHQLATAGTGIFLGAFVLLPSLAGIGLGSLLGPGRLSELKPVLKISNSTTLLMLNYVNAAAALPQSVADPDWDFLSVMLAIVVTLCVVGFASGAVVARLLCTDGSRRTSLIFALGMNNNGTGLVLGATALAHLPTVLLPVICYNLVQHVVAAAADILRRRVPVLLVKGS